MGRLAPLLLAGATFFWFLYDAIRPGWSNATSDFPNYYVAAKLVPTDVPLRAYYDYRAFQREIAHSGITQLGGYIPQTPLTMLPLVPLARFDPPTAKRFWLIANLCFLAVSLWLLSKMTRFGIAQLWLLSFLGYAALKQNFVLGQYYVFLLTILTVGFYSLLRARQLAAGTAFACAFALKLYGAPFALYLFAKRRWRGTGAMLLCTLIAIGIVVVLFGWHGVAFFATQILPRALSGETLDPFHPSNGTLLTFLRKTFVHQPELFAFFRIFFTVALLLLPAFAAWKQPGLISKREIAWWTVAILAISPNTASYTFVLLIAPVALLLDGLPKRNWLWILPGYLILTMPLYPAWSFLFPKAWTLLIFFVVIGWQSFSRAMILSATSAGIIMGAAGAAWAAKHPEIQSPSATQIAAGRGEIYSRAPVAIPSGIAYESIGDERYLIRFANSSRALSFDGEAFHPTAPDSGESIYFELASHSHSSIACVRFDNGQLSIVNLNQPDPSNPAISHDGHTLAFVSGDSLFISGSQGTRKIATPEPVYDASFVPGDQKIVLATNHGIFVFDLNTNQVHSLIEIQADLGSPSISPDGNTLLYASRSTGEWQVWTKALPNGPDRMITNGPCNSRDPAWVRTADEILFASDCGRGLGLPSLYRMKLTPAVQAVGHAAIAASLQPRTSPALTRAGHAALAAFLR